MACVRGEQAVKPHAMGSRTRHQRRQAGDEVERLEQDVGGAIAKRVLELVDHQPGTKYVVTGELRTGVGTPARVVTVPQSWA